MPLLPGRRAEDDCAEGYSAVRGNDLLHSGDVDNKLAVFLWENLLKVGIKLDGDKGKTKEKRRLFLNSCGGSVCCMLSIVDLFEEVDDLTTVATGACMSAAVPLIAAGTPGKRYATHRTRFMLHPPSTSFDADLDALQLASEAVEGAVLADVYAEIMYRYCDHSRKWWKDKVKSHTSWYFGPEVALEHGIIDKILPDRIRGKVYDKKK